MISRRQLAALPLAALMAGRRKGQEEMGWASNIYPLLIVYSAGGTTPTGLFLYSPTPGPGNLVASFTESSEDPYGNATVPGGFATYDSPAGQAVLFASNGLFLATGSFSTGWTISPTVQFQMASNGSGFTSALFFEEIAAPAAIVGGPWLWGNTSGHLETVSDILNGDGNNYDLEQLTIILQSSFTINSTSPQTIMSHHVGIGTYDIEVWMNVANSTAADGASFALSGPAAAAAPQLMDWINTSGTNPAAVTHNASGTYTAANTNQGVAGSQQIVMRATAKFTAAGTLAITGAEAVSGNTVVVGAGSKLKIRPVVAT